MDLGAVKPARAGDTLAVCVIENRLGMDEEYPTIAEGRNAAAHRLLEPVLQGAIDYEFWGKMREFTRQGLREYKARTAAYGVTIDV
jgi:3-dehydroquinate dehydratase